MVDYIHRKVTACNFTIRQTNATGNLRVTLNFYSIQRNLNINEITTLEFLHSEMKFKLYQ